MTSYQFDHILLDGTWKQNVCVETDSEGLIVSIMEEQGKGVPVKGFALPGFVNAHSHAFQYAMVGTAEIFGNPNDDFWSWRQQMYRVALTINPADMRAIAAMLYAEMLANGYTHVVEFHYLHHDEKGGPYNPVTSMGESLMEAAMEAGIGMTLVPIYYNTGSLGKPSSSEQKRFISSDINEYGNLMEHYERIANSSSRISLGYGPHSIRAANASDIKEMRERFKEVGPFHMHISEQLKEVEESVSFYGKRPVQWLSEEIGLTPDMHLVHATHLDDVELDLVSASGAGVILCPSTEGNLGDGIFRLPDFHRKRGNFTIGSDSHIGISPIEEIRWMDYQHRLLGHRRNATGNMFNAGEDLYERVVSAGWKAAGIDGSLKNGNSLSVVVLDSEHPLLYGAKEENLVNTWIYHGDRSMIDKVISGGKVHVEKGKHNKETPFRHAFSSVIRNLKIR